MEEVSREEIKNELMSFISTFNVMIAAQYILQQEQILEYYREKLNGSMKNDKEYNEAVISNDIIKNDDELIEIIYEKINELNYSEEDENLCSKTMNAIAPLLNASELLKVEKWTDIKMLIIDLMKKMNIRDLITIIEMAGVREPLSQPEIQELVINRMPEMSEYEFMRLITDLYRFQVVLNDNLDEAISKKMKTTSKVYAPRYIARSKNSDDIIDRMDVAGNAERIELIIEGLYFDEEIIENKILELANELTDEEIVILMVAISENNEDRSQKLDEYLIRRVQNLSDEDIGVILVAYQNSNEFYVKGSLIKIALERKIVQKQGENIHMHLKVSDKGDFFNRISVYRKYNDIISSIPTSMLEVDLSEALELISESDERSIEEIQELQEDMQEQHLERYKLFNEQIDINEELLEYIKQLSELDDKSLVKAIGFLKNKLIQIDEELEGNLLNMRRIAALGFTQVYLNHRILTIKDKGAIALLATLYNEDNEIYNEAIAAKLATSIDQIKLEIPDNSER